VFLRYEAALNGKIFSDIAPEVLLRDIVEQPADVDSQANPRAGLYGQSVPTRKRLALSVRLVYRIREYDSRKRAEIRDKVAEWANGANGGGWLTINTRPGMQLQVVCDTPPNLDSSLKWTQDLTLTLTAYAIPFWQEAGDGQAVELDTVWADNVGMYKGSVAISPKGNAGKVPVTCFAYNMDDKPLTHLKIIVDDTMMEFKGMNIAGGGVLGGWFSLDYTDEEILQIKNVRDDNDPSLLQYRTAESDDDLLAQCKARNEIHVYSDATVNITFFVRGRWL
jgi:hypothetical protein